MNKNNNALYILLGVIAMIGLQMVIRFIGIENLSVQVIDTFYICIGTIVLVAEYKGRKKGFGIKYNMTIGILSVITCFFGVVITTIDKCYPNFADKYGAFFAIIFVVSLFILILFIIIYKIIYELKHR